MDKLTMAHDYAMQLVASPDYDDDMSLVDFVAHVWKYADAMQAEAEKRECKERPDVLKEEWQPDWSQAPEWANWWAMDGNGDSYWHSCVDEPFVNESIFEIANPQGHTFDAPSFGYQGNWKESLRKRPQ